MTTMNRLQCIGIFIIRILGILALLIAVLGAGYYGGVAVGVVESRPTNPPSLVASAMWFVVGLSLLFFAGPLGRWLGRGLD
jgi:hypothetical protein